MSKDMERVDEWKKEHNYRIQESDDPTKWPNPVHCCEDCIHRRIHWYNCTVECTLCCPRGCQWMEVFGICDEWEGKE